MELGGKAPAIVCDDADLERAAKMCAWGAFHHSGQICMSTERIIVFQSVKQQFKECLHQATEQRAAQDPSAMQLIAAAPVAKNKSLIRDALLKGAKIIYGDVEIEDVSEGMNIYAIESFGPTVSLLVVNSDDEAIQLANETQYGPTSSVFTRDLARGFKYARAIVSGAVHINSPTIHD